LAINYSYTPPAVDLGVSGISAPTGLILPVGSYTVKAWVKNFTTGSATPDRVEFYVGTTLIGTATGIAAIPGSDSVEVTCPNLWTPISGGDYTLTATVFTTGDPSPSNDSHSQYVIFVQ